MRKPLIVNIVVGLVGIALGAGIMFLALGARAGGTATSNTNAVQIDNVGIGKLPPKGSADAKVKIIEFADFQCPYCKQWHDTVASALLAKYGDKVAIYYRHYPLTSIHPQAMDGAVAAECAAAQGKFWEMHDALYASQDNIGVSTSQALAKQIGLDTDKFNNCLANDPVQPNIDADVVDGVAYGVQGTPTFFVNNRRLVGALPLERFSAVIDQELSK